MKKKIRLSESRLKNIIARVIKEEFSYPDTYNHTYNRRFTNDYQGLFSMIKQYGCNAKFGGEDIEGEYPQNLEVYIPEDKYDIKLAKTIYNLMSARGWELNKQFSGEYDRGCYVLVFYNVEDRQKWEDYYNGSGDDLNESRINRIIKESVRRVLKENTEIVNNKNYVFDPSTRTGIDRTMGYDMKFRYTGKNLENFTNLLRRSDGDDFNPDWLESCGGVEFDDNGYGSSYGPQQDTQELQELRDKIKAAGGMLVQGDIEQGVERYASPATMNMIKQVGDAVVWIIELDNNENYVSQKPYKSEEAAYRACNKVLKMLGQDLYAEVCGIFYEDGELEADTLMYKEPGDDFWMD